jgi:hypothetical protein
MCVFSFAAWQRCQKKYFFSRTNTDTIKREKGGSPWNGKNGSHSAGFPDALIRFSYIYHC